MATVTAPVSMSKIKAVFGGTGRMSEYYRGGPRVPNIAANNAISTTAAGLRMSQFEGATDVTGMTVTANNVSYVAEPQATEAIGSSTAFVSNAPGAVTYSWTLISGSSLLYTGQTSQTATFRTSNQGEWMATYRVTATSVGQTATATISVYLQLGNIQ